MSEPLPTPSGVGRRPASILEFTRAMIDAMRSEVEVLAEEAGD